MADSLFRTKSVGHLMADSQETGEHALKRTLGPWALAALGIGAMAAGTAVFAINLAASLHRTHQRRQRRSNVTLAQVQEKIGQRAGFGFGKAKLRHHRAGGDTLRIAEVLHHPLRRASQANFVERRADLPALSVFLDEGFLKVMGKGRKERLIPFGEGAEIWLRQWLKLRAGFRPKGDELFVGHTETTKNVTGLVLRLGAGMSFTLSERARLLFLPVALSLQVGTGFSAYVPTLGLAYRL